VKHFYAAAAILGAIAPFAVYFGYLSSVPGAQGALSLAWANPIAAATLTDFTISCLVFWPFLFVESKRVGVRHPWFFVVTNIVVGLSFALPAFLFMRERALERSSPLGPSRN
jgi:hypothetical protein